MSDEPTNAHASSPSALEVAAMIVIMAFVLALGGGAVGLFFGLMIRAGAWAMGIDLGQECSK